MTYYNPAQLCKEAHQSPQQPEEPMRIRDVAQEAGLSVKEILLIAYELNIYAKTGFSPLSEVEATKIKAKALQKKDTLSRENKGIKVSNLAKEFQLPSKNIVDIAQCLNITNIRNGHSFLKEGQAERIRKRLATKTI